MHKHTLWIGALAITAVAAGCGGSNRNGGTQGASGTSGSADVNAGRTMTLRGCVEPSSPGGTYLLRTIGSAEGTGGTAGTSGGTQSSGGADVNGTKLDQNGATYRLIATGNLDIGQNLGKEVSVSGEIANQAQDQRPGAPGASGTAGTPGSNDRTRRQGTSGEGDAGTNLQSGASQGSGNGRVQGSAADEYAGARFFRVTSMTKVSDNCATGESGSDADKGRQRR